MSAKARPWLYLASVFGSQLFGLVILATLWTLFPPFRHWVGTPFGTFAAAVFGWLLAFSVVLLFSESRLDLFNLFELQSVRQGFTYFAPGAGFLFGLAGVFLPRIGMEHLADNYPLMRPFISLPGPEKYLLVVLLLVAPLFEEIVVRGFLYRAFRNSYGIIMSVVTAVVAAMLAHPGVMATSLWLFLFLGAFQIMLCLMFERRRNLWNCIACHFVYNATVAGAWLMELSS